MKKHKKAPKKKFRNGLRNAAPAAPRPPRAPRAPKPAAGEDTVVRRLGYTAAGAAGTALVGSFLAREGWAPKTIAGLLTVAGGVAAGTSHDPMVQRLGSGAMSAAGGQLALLMLDDRESKGTTSGASHSPIPKRSNAGALPPGALENAFERARARMAVMTEDARSYGEGHGA